MRSRAQPGRCRHVGHSITLLHRIKAPLFVDSVPDTVYVTQGDISVSLASSSSSVVSASVMQGQLPAELFATDPGGSAPIIAFDSPDSGMNLPEESACECPGSAKASMRLGSPSKSEDNSVRASRACGGSACSSVSVNDEHHKLCGFHY